MAVTFSSTSAPATGTGASIDTTGETLALPSDTQQIEIYLSAAGWYTRTAHDSASAKWVPLPATTWATIREVGGSAIGIKAASGTVTAYVDAVSPGGVRGGR